jgi:FAD/FMN-containing dehydrogenase
MWERPEDDERNIAWVREIDRALKPWAQEASYLNYLMDEGEGRIRASFGQYYGRMVALKDRYDPGNLFHMNQNIKPSR